MSAKTLTKKILPIFDVFIAVLSIPFGIFGLLIRRTSGLHPITDRVLEKIGVYPIRDHYYEPLINPEGLTKSLDEVRNLPGIDWNLDRQKNLLSAFTYKEELESKLFGAGGVVGISSDSPVFQFGNDAFESGDADIWYSVVRHFKPQRIVEIGSGHSTLVAREAVAANINEDSNYVCEHSCIEPYEQPWLEQTGAKIIRELVEETDPSIFSGLQDNDILFIDSSHVIRPQGDVLFEYLEILPNLPNGVIVHIHDIFSPRDYPASWVKDYKRLWNEQYILEAFLSLNKEYEVLISANHLQCEHPELLDSVCAGPKAERNPGSFYIRRRST